MQVFRYWHLIRVLGELAFIIVDGARGWYLLYATPFTVEKNMQRR
jgi:hypothetical protein